MNHIVRILLFVFFCSLFSSTSYARKLKIATLAPAGTTWMKEMKSGAKKISERTGGRVKLKFYPGGVMGNDQSVHRKIRVGQLQGGAFTSGGLAPYYSGIQAYSLPMLFDSFEEIDYVRSKMDPMLKQEMENHGYELLGISDGGFARILSKQPMRDLKSIRAGKVWIPEGDLLGQKTFAALGISPIALPISDVFTGLQTGLIETVAVNPTAAIAFQWHTSTSYMTDTPITFLIGVLAIQKKAFAKLSKHDQQVVKEEVDAVFRKMDQLNRRDNIAAKAALLKQGIEFVTPDATQLALWKSLSMKAIDDMVAAGLIPAEIVSQVMHHLATFRASQ